MNRRTAAALGVVLFVSAATPAAAQRVDDTVLGDRGSDMAADLLFVRPLGLVGTLIGAGLFVVSLPFTLPTGSTGDAAREMVGEPFEYTFNRPLGDFNHCGADRHPCGAGRR